jgi:hypothetical protein
MTPWYILRKQPENCIEAMRKTTLTYLGQEVRSLNIDLEPELLIRAEC